MFVLVNPPFASLHRPNLGLSLLKGQLTRVGHPCQVYYADQLLARTFGVADYQWVERDYEALKGEWLFSGFVRADNQWDLTYLDTLRERGYSESEVDSFSNARNLLEAYLDQVCRDILKMGPVAVGCSSTFQQNNAALAILRRIKERAPGVVTVLGGANVEGELAVAARRFEWVDVVVSGEAEGTIGSVYELALQHGAALPKAQLPTDRGKVEDMDALAMADFDDYFQARHPEVQPVLTLEGSRGCWWGQVQHCTFCGLNGSGMNYRAKSPQRLLAEIFHLSERHQVSVVEMVDNIIAPRHLKDVLPALQGSGLEFFWEVKANLKAAHFAALAAAGVRRLQPGIESFSGAVLELMRKGQRPVQNVFVLKAARENGIRLYWNLLLGHPGETAQDLELQRELAHSLAHLQPPQACCSVRPDRFSPLFSEGHDLEPFDVYRQIYDLEPEQLAQIAYLWRFAERPLEPVYQARREALERKVQAWSQAWERPQLRSLHWSGTAQVCDQRWPGQKVSYELSEAEAQVLRWASEPRRLQELAVDVTRLCELRLCVRDDFQILSLVLPVAAEQLPPLPAA